MTVEDYVNNYSHSFRLWAEAYAACHSTSSREQKKILDYLIFRYQKNLLIKACGKNC